MKPIILSDVDGVLNRSNQSWEFEPVKEWRQFMTLLNSMGYEIVLWSGGGAKWAEWHANKLGVAHFVTRYFDKFPYLEATVEQVRGLLGAVPVMQIDDDVTEAIQGIPFHHWMWPQNQAPKRARDGDKYNPSIGK